MSPIAWDEMALGDRKLLEGLDQTLRFLRDDGSVPFGNSRKRSVRGVTVVVSGDFRQNLLDVPSGNYAAVVATYLKRSLLWPSLKTCGLTDNMRLRRNDSGGDALSFAWWL